MSGAVCNWMLPPLVRKPRLQHLLLDVVHSAEGQAVGLAAQCQYLALLSLLSVGPQNLTRTQGQVLNMLKGTEREETRLTRYTPAAVQFYRTNPRSGHQKES